MAAETPDHDSNLPRPLRREAAKRVWRTLRSPIVQRLVSAAFFGAAAWLIWRQLSVMSWSAFWDALSATPPWAVLLSVGCTGASYACLSGTEWLALRALGHRLRYRDAAKVAVPAYALTNSAGFSPATGTMFRVQLYARQGFSGPQAAAVAMLAGGAVTVSGVVTAGLLMLLDPSAFGEGVRGPAWAVALLGAGLVTPAALWFYAFTPAAPSWLGGGRTSPPRRSARLIGLFAGLGDWLFSGAALFVLMPGPHLAIFPTFLAAYVAGCLLSAATGVPGGIGVFEAIVLALTAVFTQVHETAAALLLYRGIYSLGPLAIWGVVVLVRGRGRRSQARRGSPP
jgi:uncharacterized membrane protein YbhN (UPF0104 family)